MSLLAREGAPKYRAGVRPTALRIRAVKDGQLTRVANDVSVGGPTRLSGAGPLCPIFTTKSLGNDGPAVEREPPIALVAARSAKAPGERL